MYVDMANAVFPRKASNIATAAVETAQNFVQSRDEHGRFASSKSTNSNSVQKDVKQIKPLCMDEIESTTPYIYNFVKDNGVVKTLIKDRDLRACLYLNKETESYYLFFASHYAFGFHLSCGVLAEVLNNEDTAKLVSEYDLLYWDSIQKV